MIESRDLAEKYVLYNVHIIKGGAKILLLNLGLFFSHLFFIDHFCFVYYDIQHNEKLSLLEDYGGDL